jgi:diguanylate cyclase (GGDEF)-like protein/PAS domain S-box-containing protein
MPMAAGSHSGIVEADLEVFERSNDLIVVSDGAGNVAYANPLVGRVLGYAAGETVGKNIADLVHPDDLIGAIEALDDIQTGRPITPAIFRILSSDGSWLAIEFTGTSRIEGGPFAGRIVFTGRYSGDHYLHMRIGEMLTSGAAMEDVIALVPEFGLWRHPDQPYLVLYTGIDGKPAHVGTDLAAQLVADHPGDDTPWAIALAKRQMVQVASEDLPRGLREEALAVGLEDCLVFPVPDPLHDGTALIVAWSVLGGPRHSVHRYAIGQMTHALDLIMHWRQQTADLERAARFDGLTGLINRASFFDKLGSGTFGGIGSDELIGVLYVDLDEFKVVNDRYGHGAGDDVLIEASRRMTSVLREHDVLARLGGDEFGALCVGIHHVDEAIAVAERLLGVLREPVEVDGHAMVVSASIGIAVSPVAALVSDWLVERADEAMYQAKTSGRNCWRLAAYAACPIP